MSEFFVASTGNFTSYACGQNKGVATSSTGLQPGSTVSINGNIDLSSCMVGPDGAAVYSINLVPNAGFYSYKLDIIAQGPSGFGSGSLYLAFTDKMNDTYYIFIYSGHKEEHTLSYNSSSPSIIKIEWSDQPFPDR